MKIKITANNYKIILILFFLSFCDTSVSLLKQQTNTQLDIPKWRDVMKWRDIMAIRNGTSSSNKCSTLARGKKQLAGVIHICIHTNKQRCADTRIHTKQSWWVLTHSTHLMYLQFEAPCARKQVYCNQSLSVLSNHGIFRCAFSFLADRTATQYDRLLAAACCPSVCLSVCLWRCVLCMVYGVKSYTSMFLAGMFLFVPFDTFAVGCIV